MPAGGAEIQGWDAYGQPTGIHYQPHGASNHFQAAEWLDFQSCQTGHEGKHVAERVADMWRNLPVKGVLNGEPSYEHSGRRGKATGWWQGHEAWSNLCAGGTMDIAYGAASLWQWRLHADEPVPPAAAGTRMCAGWRPDGCPRSLCRLCQRDEAGVRRAPYRVQLLQAGCGHGRGRLGRRRRPPRRAPPGRVHVRRGGVRRRIGRGRGPW